MDRPGAIDEEAEPGEPIAVAGESRPRRPVGAWTWARHPALPVDRDAATVAGVRGDAVQWAGAAMMWAGDDLGRRFSAGDRIGRGWSRRGDDQSGHDLCRAIARRGPELSAAMARRGDARRGRRVRARLRRGTRAGQRGGTPRARARRSTPRDAWTAVAGARSGGDASATPLQSRQFLSRTDDFPGHIRGRRRPRPGRCAAAFPCRALRDRVSGESPAEARDAVERAFRGATAQSERRKTPCQGCWMNSATVAVEEETLSSEQIAALGEAIAETAAFSTRRPIGF